MIYRLLLLFFLISSCKQISTDSESIQLFNSKGIAFIYNENDLANKVINKKLNNELIQIAHNKLRTGTLVKLINPKTNDYLIIKTTKKIDYPDFYKVLITDPAASKLNLNNKFPFIEVLEIRRNKSFVAGKTKIFNEEKKIHSKAPVELVKIDNISKRNEKKPILNKDKIFIIIADFYYKNSAINLKERINKELLRFDIKKLTIKTKKNNITTLLSGPYSSINFMKNDYIQLKNFGFEELDISINE